ncbi:MAG: endo alpha-1,4 polygalactosaminidase [Pseudobdellovibrionaceae bacterium]
MVIGCVWSLPIGGHAAGNETPFFPDSFSWDIFLSRVPELDEVSDKNIIVLDAFETPAEFVNALHAQGKKAICYINAGSFEDWRPDAHRYPKEIIGKSYEGWDGEWWLDIRRMEELEPMMTERIDMCRHKGFDGVDFDNVNGYENDTGFPLTKEHQLTFNAELARKVHEAGLKVGLKNAPELADDLEPLFDWVITESCVEEGWCGSYEAFTRQGKPVMAIEYDAKSCVRHPLDHVHVIVKDMELSKKAQICAHNTKE